MGLTSSSQELVSSLRLYADNFATHASDAPHFLIHAAVRYCDPFYKSISLQLYKLLNLTVLVKKVWNSISFNGGVTDSGSFVS